MSIGLFEWQFINFKVLHTATAIIPHQIIQRIPKKYKGKLEKVIQLQIHFMHPKHILKIQDKVKNVIPTA